MRVFTQRLIALFIIISAVSVFAQTEELDTTKPVAETEATPNSATDPAAKPDATAEATPKPATGEGAPSAKSDIFVNSKTSFELQAVDDDSSVDFIEYRINNGEFIKYSSPISLPSEGANKITYRSVDKADNREAAKVLVVTVDNTAPQVKVSSSAPIYETDKGEKFAPKGISVELKAKDNISGVAKLEYSLNGAEKQAYTAPIAIQNSGSNIIKYTAADNAGNSTGDETYIVTVDENKPKVDIKSSVSTITVGEKVYSKKDSLYAVVAFDAESGVKKVLVKVDDATDYTPYVEPITFTTAGQHNIEAMAVDNVGNESEVKKVTFMVDINPPKTIIKEVKN